MRPKSIIALIAVVGLSLALIAGGCRHDNSQAQAPEASPTQNIAPSDVKTEGKAAANASDKPSDKPSDKTSETPETNSIVDSGGEGADFPEREEIRRSYTLKPGSQVRIANVNGKVEIETAETDRAEVLVVRSARKREDFQFRRVNIEHTPDWLQIRVEEDRRSVFSLLGSVPEGRQRVILKMPRKTIVEIDDVNGNVAIGEMDAGVDVRGVNGKVTVAQATGAASFRGVNGNIEATIAKLAGEGIDLSGVNGSTTLRFVGEVNANVSARGFNGRVEADLPNVEAKPDERRHGRYEARIGGGGAPIEIRGVNGNVYLSKADKPVAATAKAAKK